MTNLQIFESGLCSDGELGDVIKLLESVGNYCFIGGLALNAYCDPVFTADADIVLAVNNEQLSEFREQLKSLGFKTKLHKYWLSAHKKSSHLQIQITRDERYMDFPLNAENRDIFGLPAKVASVKDLTKGKLMAYNSPERSEVKKAKDRLDLIRLGIAFSEIRNMLPDEILVLVKKDMQ